MTGGIDRSIGKRAGRDLPGDRQNGDQRITGVDGLDGDRDPSASADGTDLSREKCTAWIRRKNRRCTAWPIKGGTVCSAHGGSAPQVRAAAERRVAAAQATSLIERYLGTGDGGQPSGIWQALRQLIAETIVFKQQVADRMALLDPADWRYSGRAGEQLRAELSLYERALDRCGKFLEVAARLDIDQRMARITETQLRQIEGAVMGTLGELGLTLEVQDQARQILARRMSGG